MGDEVITLERKERWGALKVYTFKIVDATKEAITFDVSSYVNHIFWANIRNITRKIEMTFTWTDGSESISIGNEYTANDVLKVILIGS